MLCCTLVECSSLYVMPSGTRHAQLLRFFLLCLVHFPTAIPLRLHHIFSHSLTHSLTHPPTHSLTHSLTHSQLELKFSTNTPSNLPSPPLLPGEVIQIQQHRVVCTDVFSEPAVGAVYITNYRIIFSGNLISVQCMLWEESGECGREREGWRERGEGGKERGREGGRKGGGEKKGGGQKCN